MNRKERRLLEKQLGLMKKYQTALPKEKAEIKERRQEMGQKLHLQNLENDYNAQQAANEKAQVAFIHSMMEKGYSAKEAREMLDRNLQIEEKHKDDLEDRNRKYALRRSLRKNSSSK